MEVRGRLSDASQRGVGKHALVSGAKAFVAGAAFFAICSALIPIRDEIPLVVVWGLVYVAAVVVVARRLGPQYGVPLSIAAGLAFDSFYIPPTRPLSPHDWQNWAALSVYLGLATLIGGLAAGTRRRADTSESARSELAGEQAALRRVATLVAKGAPPDAVFEAVAVELARLLNATITWVLRYDRDGGVTVMGGWGAPGLEIPIGRSFALEGAGVAITVQETGRPARAERFVGPPGSASGFLQRLGARSGVGSPIVVDGVAWGVTVAAFTWDEPLASDSETRITRFTELVATAIANAEAREELRRVADEQTALRRVATLVANGVSPEDVLQAVTREVLAVFDADGTMIVRLETGGDGTVVAHVGALLAELPVGSRWRFEPPLALGHALETGTSARVDDYGDARGGVADAVRRMGIRSSVASPIAVGGRLWGAIAIGTENDRFPPDTEQRMVDFTELLATAIANAEAQAALTASRARVVAAADETRRRIERDLHDGAQQRLVSLALRVRAVQSAVPTPLEQLATELDQVAAGLTAALDELREFAQGIHPAILAERGLEPALRTLARRSAVPVELRASTGGRLPEAVEAGAYYVVSEALANVAKHAQASLVEIEVEARQGILHVRVRDDGIGGARFDGGSGLVGLRDRVDALGGRITLQSERGGGTSLDVELPVSSPPG